MDGHEAAGVERDDEAAAPGPNGSEFSNWAEFDSGRHPISPEAGFSTQSTPEGGDRIAVEQLCPPSSTAKALRNPFS